MNEFETEIWRSIKTLQAKGRHIGYRLTDTSLARRTGAYALRQPADFMVYGHGTLTLIECKQITKRDTKSFELRYVNDTQLDSMIKWMDVGARAYIAINNRTVPRRHEAWMVHPIYVKKLKGEGVKSIKWTEMYNYGPRLTKHKGSWNIDEII